ncbi:phosphomannomutase/phosphoglucomutase [Burkholderiaceae bacterium DAT-1]|nr:phosphomannomutase/phosphoglucomutase [Burkholderiaceae bacterium DAT-1]
MAEIASGMFKAYDIRGIVGDTLTEDAALLIGKAIGSEALSRKQSRIAVGRDGRLSSPALSQALIDGICSTGIHVTDIGRVPTPVVWFAAHHLETGCGVVITGSHNPPEYNGIKIMLGGETLAGDAIQNLLKRVQSNHFVVGDGKVSQHDIRPAYLDRITSDVKLARRMSIVVDAGNGVAGELAPVLFRRLDCRVRGLYCEIDGTFPNHHPDPAQPHNLEDLARALKMTDAEIGLAFDGDADRLGVVTKSGRIVYPDRLLMLFAADALSRQSGGKIVYDVKSTRLLTPWIKQHKGKPIMARTGHSYMKAKMKESGALVGGELSGHIFFNERWYGFDDGMYAGARLLEVLSQVEDANALLDALPEAVSTPELHVPVTEGSPHELVDRIRANAKFGDDADISTIDGIRVDYEDGFGLIRASNTTPVLVLRFEGDDAKALKRIQAVFRKILSKDMPGVTLPF